ncbi:MAG: hypothetical protein WB383_00725 [Acidimicrobiales bacterium]
MAATRASTKEVMVRMGDANLTAAHGYQHATADRGQAIARSLLELAAAAKVIAMARHRFIRSMNAR